ncbi:hypothetical protein NUU61_001742 [Penicillium alfredii]|uniref:Uncharacterized protein n=1 Tax=Penicillium alfredii TaxID=1506179 RepID=A0A9W9FQ99_9EURO|nr:uncharacterized protein NUU61_001742 [Penicillium alfredii]KAJ5104395.1 hypothetical protein NUU61_001742 [Penicillium alfredii]
MAALTMTPTRQPLGSLDTPRMHTLMRSKLNRQNLQNGAALSAKSSIFVDVDTENVDPALSQSAKRKRTFDEDDKGSSKPVKTSRMVLTTRDTNRSLHVSSTPLKISPSTPKSAPVLKPAGRSPPSKSCKSSGRRSNITKARPEPPSKRGVSRPFSLATALSQNKAPKPQPKAPASWFFDIHVDSEQEEMTNLMQHSTNVLDISDDETKSQLTDGRGKENMPPVELGIELPQSRPSSSTTATAAAARKDSKMDEDRAPLGELNAADYYPEDCNAFSYAVVFGEDDTPESKKAPASAPPAQHARTLPPVTTSIASLLDTTPAPKPAVDTKATESIDADTEIKETLNTETPSSDP